MFIQDIVIILAGEFILCSSHGRVLGVGQLGWVFVGCAFC